MLLWANEQAHRFGGQTSSMMKPFELGIPLLAYGSCEDDDEKDGTRIGPQSPVVSSLQNSTMGEGERPHGRNGVS